MLLVPDNPNAAFDWQQCAEVEWHGGAAVLRGTGFSVEYVMDNHGCGFSTGEIAAFYHLNEDQVGVVISFAAKARRRRNQAGPRPTPYCLPEIDWADCAEVEMVPDKVSWCPTLTHSRVMADSIILNYQSGGSVEEIAEMFELPARQVHVVRDHALQYLARLIGYRG
jgi:uncharacterized protein (DUF433 family)